MAQKTHKTPEELEQAVGKKIDELFGDLFGDEGPQESETPSPPAKSAPAPAAAPAKPVRPAERPPAPAPEKKPAVAPAKVAPKPPAPSPVIPPSPVTERRAAGTFEDVSEQMEILILNLEWEVSPDSVSGLIKKFKELEKFFPAQGQARTILAMNQRGLQQFSTPDSVPHPALVRLLQDSLAALKLIQASQGKRPPSDNLITSITASYKEIMGVSPAADAAQKDKGRRSEDDRRAYTGAVNNVGTAIHSLEEVSQRLARILGVLRQGGEMSTEEITRRLGTLEHLLSERVGQLRTFHKELAAVPAPSGEGAGGAGTVPANAGPDGLLMVSWEGISLAIPSTAVAALYPLSRVQAQDFAGKQTIVLGSRQIPRLPLKKPQGGDQGAKPPPGWLLHLSSGKKDFFLLAERTLGFRTTPKGIDLSKQTKIKIGATAYNVLNMATFR